MAKIDYFGIKEEIKNVILSSSLTYTHEISVEGDIVLDSFDNLIDIEIDSRAIASTPIAAGTKARYNLLAVVMVYSKHFERSKAIEIRDILIGELEVIFMQNRTFNNKVDTSWLLGGQNIVAWIEDQSAFVAGGEIRMNIESEIII